MHSAQSMTIGMCTAGLPGIYNVNLASHTMGEGKSQSWWSRGVSKLKKPSVPNADFSLSMICLANHAAPRPGGPRAAPDRRRASPGGALTAVPAFASAHRAPAPEHRRRREFAALRASRLRAGEEGGGAAVPAPLPTRAPEGRGMQGDARAAAGR